MKSPVFSGASYKPQPRQGLCLPVTRCLGHGRDAQRNTCQWTEWGGGPVRWVSFSIVPPPQAPFSIQTLKFPSPWSHPFLLSHIGKHDNGKGFTKGCGLVPRLLHMHRDQRDPTMGQVGRDRPGCASAKARETQPLMSRPPSPVGPIYLVSGKPTPGLQARNLHWVAPDPHHLCPAIWSPRTRGGEGSPTPDRRQLGTRSPHPHCHFPDKLA